MALSSVEQKQLGLAKESVRGTAITTPTKWYPVEPTTEFDYKLHLLVDKSVRGTPEEFPANAGVKDGTGKIKMPLDAQMCGEFFYGLLGSYSGAAIGGTAAYKHTFTRGTSIQRQTYTGFLDRGLSIKKYNMMTVKKIILTIPVDNIAMMETDVLFQTEATGVIGSPAFPVNNYLGFNSATIKIGGAQNTDIKNCTINLDNGAAHHRTLNNSQDVADILIKGKQVMDGSFTVYFQNETERAKFLANTTTSFEAVLAGVAIPAAPASNWTVDINLYKIHYKAYPFGDADGILAANVSFMSVYDSVATKQVQVDVTNVDTTY